jgi:hypothetical protein
MCSTSMLSEERFEGMAPLLETPLTVAIVKCQMRQWTSVFFRKSCPYEGLFLGYWETFKRGVLHIYDDDSIRNATLKKGTAPDEVVPGMTAFDLINILLIESMNDGILIASDLGLLDILELHCGAYKSESGPFSHLSIEERIDLMNRVNEWKQTSPVSKEKKVTLFPSFVVLSASKNSKILFETLAVIRRQKQPVSDYTLLFYEYCRQRLIDGSMPSLQTYLECSKQHGKKRLPNLPQECLELIAEFACSGYFQPPRLAEDEKKASVGMQVATRLGMVDAT